MTEDEEMIRQARLKAASMYVADLLRHGEISEEEYPAELESVSKMPVPAILNLVRATSAHREGKGKLRDKRCPYEYVIRWRK